MKYFLMVLFIILFTGCAKSYNIKPSYDEDTKIVKIGDFVIPDISYYKEKPSNTSNSSLGNLRSVIKTIRSDSNICDTIYAIDYTSSDNWIYYNSAKEDILATFKDKCTVEDVGENLSFLKWRYF